VATGITGLNHITLAVADVGRSIEFYRDVLGCTVRAAWPDGAYLEAGPLWLCLSRDDQARTSSRSDYTHVAFNISEENYTRMSERLAAVCIIWKDNKSEGDSIYFLDPDGHKLEIHLGSLETRLRHYRRIRRKVSVCMGDVLAVRYQYFRWVSNRRGDYNLSAVSEGNKRSLQSCTVSNEAKKSTAPSSIGATAQSSIVPDSAYRAIVRWV